MSDFPDCKIHITEAKLNEQIQIIEIYNQANELEAIMTKDQVMDCLHNILDEELNENVEFENDPAEFLNVRALRAAAAAFEFMCQQQADEPPF